MQGRELDGGAGFPAACEAGTDQVGGVDGWVAWELGSVEGEEVVEFRDELLQVAEG